MQRLLRHTTYHVLKIERKVGSLTVDFPFFFIMKKLLTRLLTFLKHYGFCTILHYLNSYYNIVMLTRPLDDCHSFHTVRSHSKRSQTTS